MFIVQECVFQGVIHTVWRFKRASYAYTQTISYDKPKDALQFCTENYYFDILIDEKTLMWPPDSLSLRPFMVL